MAWEELDLGLGYGAASGVSMIVGPRKRMGRVAAGANRDSLGTKDVIEFVIGAEVIAKLDLKIKNISEDQYVEEKFRIQWGTGPQMGFLRICMMNDPTLPGLELRCLRKGTVFKIRSDKLPSIYSKLVRENEPVEFDVDPNGRFIEIELPDDFYDLTPQEPLEVTVKALDAPALPRIAAPDSPKTKRQPVDPMAPVLMSIVEFEAECRKRIKGFDVDQVGNYTITLSGQRDKYTTAVVLGKLNEARRQSGIGPVVLS